MYNTEVIENILTEDESNAIIEWFKTHTHLITVGSGQDYRGIRFMHIHNRWIRDIVHKMSYTTICKIGSMYDKPVYPEMFAINKWGVGGYQDPHLDSYSNQEIELGGKYEVDLYHDGILSPNLTLKEDKTYEGNRAWTCIVNLNDDYSGGETFFPECEKYPEGYVHKPIKNSGLLFRGVDLMHGVNRVRRSPRYTVSMWFTEDPQKMMLDYPSKDLQLNEDTQKLVAWGYLPGDPESEQPPI